MWAHPFFQVSFKILRFILFYFCWCIKRDHRRTGKKPQDFCNNSFLFVCHHRTFCLPHWWSPQFSIRSFCFHSFIFRSFWPIKVIISVHICTKFANQSHLNRIQMSYSVFFFTVHSLASLCVERKKPKHFYKFMLEDRKKEILDGTQSMFNFTSFSLVWIFWIVHTKK